VNQQKRMNRKNFDVIIANVEANKAEIETLIAANLSEEWKFERLDKILKAILSAAIAEIKYSDAEKNLIISEYVSIADSFYEGDEPKFVNAVLDKIN
jgi:N utilization substance protein B